MGKYKCDCKEFEVNRTTIAVVNGEVVKPETYCEECKKFATFIKEHKGFGGIIKKPQGTVAGKF
tara:strand:+ start:76 stop:267 length:192 start_codon:yes stop_codon:yes gene_type:complete